MARPPSSNLRRDPCVRRPPLSRRAGRARPDLAPLPERRLQAQASDAPPGRDWTFTGERFFDPKSGELVEVWQRARNGERAYVRSRSG